MTVDIVKRGLVDAANCYSGDLNPELINCFNVLKNEPEAFVKRLFELEAIHGQGNRNLFKSCVKVLLKANASQFDKAIAYYIYNHLCHAGALSDRDYRDYRFAKSRISEKQGLKPHRILKLPFFADLMEPMDIQVRDYKKTMKLADGLDGAFIFIDSPYTDKSKDLYGVDFTEKNFDELAEEVHKYHDKCNIMITIDAAPEHLERFNGFKVLKRVQWYDLSYQNKDEWVMINYDVPCEEYLLEQSGFTIQQAA